MRQQTRDVVHVLQEAAGLASHYMSAPSQCRTNAKSVPALNGICRFMEDDFELCGNGMLALQYAVAKAYAYENDWTCIRFG